MCVGFCVCLYLVCITLCPFYFCNRLEEVENAFDLSLMCYRYLVNVNVLRLFIAVRWVGLQYVIVVYPGHTLTSKIAPVSMLI